MRTIGCRREVLTVVLSLLLSSAAARTASAVGTAFTYQGQLQLFGAPANATCNMQFSLWDALSGPNQIGGTLSPSVTVVNGVFSVPLDFGGNAFTGGDRWLEIGVDCPGGGGFMTLQPRQPVTASPYALLSNSVLDNAITGAKIEDGSIDTADLAQSAVRTGKIADNAVTSAKILDGSIVAADVDTNSLQRRVTGTCPGTDAMSAINADGSVICVSGGVTFAGSGTASTASHSDHDHLGQAWSGSPSAGLAVTSTANNGTGLIGQAHTGTAAWGVLGSSIPGIGVRGISNTGTGVRGISDSGPGVEGQSTSDVGVMGMTSGPADNGVLGESTGLNGNGVHGIANNGGIAYGVWGESSNGDGVRGSTVGGTGVVGDAVGGVGVSGMSNTGTGVHGKTGGTLEAGVDGETTRVDMAGVGVLGRTPSNGAGTGVAGNSGSGIGTYGVSTSGPGVEGVSTSGPGVMATSTSGRGLNATTAGTGSTGDGVLGESTGLQGNGVHGVANNGISAYGVFGESSSGYAGYFTGKVNVTGALTAGVKPFKIDHPLDPANKYLYHAAVESPDMKNIYDGIVALDDAGEAVVELPVWFEALNRDFRYQLTCIGGVAAVYVAEEVSANHFRIAGGTPGLKVSWQVTGIRKDAFANAHPLVVEQDKLASERGLYLYPTEAGMPASLSVEHAKDAPAPAQEQ